MQEPHDHYSKPLVMSKTFICIWLAVLFVTAAFIRVHGVDRFHPHVDELMHIDIAKGATLEEVLHFSLFETHPPLGHLVRHYWEQISDTVWFERCLSLVFGLGLIPLYYAIGNRLHGRLAGLCAATLITFSNGCIIQSYIVRNYTIFTFFLSLSVYMYLLWREDRQKIFPLIGYFICALLAVLIHFSALFALCMITFYGLWEKPGGRIRWAIANLLLAALSLWTIQLWHNTLNSVQETAAGAMASYSFKDSLLLIPLYLVHVFNYLFPSESFIFVLAFLAPMAMAKKDKALNAWLMLSGLSLLLGVVLFITGIYPFVGDRHGLWLLPFFIISMGWLIADAFLFLTKSFYLSAGLAFSCGLLFYTAQDRFVDSTEYAMTEKEWQQVSGYLQSVDPRSLLVSGKTDAIMLAPPQVNMYHYLGNNPASISPIAAFIPYYGTHLLFNNRNTMRIYKNATLTQMIEDASSKGMLKEYDTLIFIDSYAASQPVTDLMQCKALDKTVVSFSASMFFIAVKKQDFMEQVISPAGKAHSCLFYDHSK